MDEHPSAVLAAYGHTMLIWQLVEQHLGQLWVLSLIGDDQTATSRNLQKSFRRSIHAATKATAGESLTGLRGQLDEGLCAELDAAIKWRDVLAHRYLRERIRGDLLRGHFMEGTSDELGELYDRFVSLASRLEALIVAEEKALAAEIEEMDEEMLAVLERIGRSLLRNEPLLTPGGDSE
jgi:hypothetical protein